MKKIFRIHGDNIIECERIKNLIIEALNPYNINYSLISPSTIKVDLSFLYNDKVNQWELQLLPGFNKSKKRRWEGNIFDILKSNGSFLEETPDIILTSVNNDTETILCALEFCSALQAGNQAWQRSGRAYSSSLAGCPYIYIVDFVKYELDQNRKRKSLRFPNPTVPYSFINYSKSSKNFTAQVYIKSEEFNKNYDIKLNSFNENNFADKELSSYLIKKMFNLDTSSEELSILNKSKEIVLYLSDIQNETNSLTTSQWKEIFDSNTDIIDYSINNVNFNFHKTIANKSHHGNSKSFLNIIDKYSVGLSTREFPIGIIPSHNRQDFANELSKLYPLYDKDVIYRIASDKGDLILCLFKGFKPAGDDNRPDRGILPLAKMLSSNNINTEIMTFLYGPIIFSNFNLLKNNPLKLAKSNGLWNSILSVSNFLALDSPIISRDDNINETAVILLENNLNYNKLSTTKIQQKTLIGSTFSNTPLKFGEDDVDTGIHYLFSHIMNNICFEGMCNPPGGDWSGFSIIKENREYRWLSLPRVGKGKRPDHLIEFNEIFSKPLLLLIESKEKSSNLENNVGNGLIEYIKNLMSFNPSVERQIDISNNQWGISTQKICPDNFEFLSAAAYLNSNAQDKDSIFKKTGCDLLFLMQPGDIGWKIEIIPNNNKAEKFKNYILESINDMDNLDITLS